MEDELYLLQPNKTYVLNNELFKIAKSRTVKRQKVNNVRNDVPLAFFALVIFFMIGFKD